MTTQTKAKQKQQLLPPSRPGEKAPTPRPREENESGGHEPLMRISGVRPSRPKITLEFEGLGSHHFELELLSKLPIADQQELIQAGNEYDALFERKLEDVADKARLKELLDFQFEKVLMKPQGMSGRDFIAIKNACDDFIRSQIVRAFTLAPLQMALAEQAQKLSEQSQNGSNENSTSET